MILKHISNDNSRAGSGGRGGFLGSLDPYLILEPPPPFFLTWSGPEKPTLTIKQCKSVQLLDCMATLLPPYFKRPHELHYGVINRHSFETYVKLKFLGCTFCWWQCLGMTKLILCYHFSQSWFHNSSNISCAGFKTVLSFGTWEQNST